MPYTNKVLPRFTALTPSRQGPSRALGVRTHSVTTPDQLDVATGFLRSREVIGVDALLAGYDPAGAALYVVLSSDTPTPDAYLVPINIARASRSLRHLLQSELPKKVLHNSPIKVDRLGEAGLEVRNYIDLMANAGWSTPLYAIARHHGLQLPEGVSGDEVIASARSGRLSETFVNKACATSAVLSPIWLSQRDVIREAGLPDNWYELQRRASRATGSTEAIWELPTGRRQYPRLTLRLPGPSNKGRGIASESKSR